MSDVDNENNITSQTLQERWMFNDFEQKLNLFDEINSNTSWTPNNVNSDRSKKTKNKKAIINAAPVVKSDYKSRNNYKSTHNM